MQLRCVCGLPPARIKRLGLNLKHQVVIHCWCAGCKKNIYVVLDLSDLWRECPKPEHQPGVSAGSTALMREPDAEFLRSMGVKFPDE